MGIKTLYDAKQIREVLTYFLLNFIESTLHDVFVYKAGVFTYFFRTYKSLVFLRQCYY